jgi:hypothetical protein
MNVSGSATHHGFHAGPARYLTNRPPGANAARSMPSNLQQSKSCHRGFSTSHYPRAGPALTRRPPAGLAEATAPVLEDSDCGLVLAIKVQVVERLGFNCHHEPSKARQRGWINTDALGPGAPAAATSRHGAAAVQVRPDRPRPGQLPISDFSPLKVNLRYIITVQRGRAHSEKIVAGRLHDCSSVLRCRSVFGPGLDPL